MRRSFPAKILMATALTLIGAACGVAETETGPAAGVVEETPAPWISVASSSLGQILVDGQGLTLYMTVAGGCTGSCAGIWPPVPFDGVAVLGDGVDDSLLGQTEREDGVLQVTYNGHSLYRYSGDFAPGDLYGQGVNDVWFVVDAKGAAVEDPPSGPGFDY